MKIFAIRDESAEVQKDLAYLLYYEFEKRFYIELPEGADPWELPLLLDKGSYIDLNGLMANLLGQPMMNDRVTLKNGHLDSPQSDAPDPEEIRNAADNIIRFRDVHADNGGDFLFVVVPRQLSKYEDLLPTGYSDTNNDND